MMYKGGRLLFSLSTEVDFGLKRPIKNSANWSVAVFETIVLGRCVLPFARIVASSFSLLQYLVPWPKYINQDNIWKHVSKH